jgi:hypothetical protein
MSCIIPAGRAFHLDAQAMIGGEHYFLSADGLLMPTRKDKASSSDLRYFKSTP